MTGKSEKWDDKMRTTETEIQKNEERERDRQTDIQTE